MGSHYLVVAGKAVKTIAIIQARMGSSRLPGKVLMDLMGQPLLARVLNRTKRTPGLDDVVVATTTSPADEKIVSFCHTYGCRVFQGSEADVLDRYFQVAKVLRADAVVRITSDCPIIDPGLNGRVIDEFLSARPSVDYVSVFLPRWTFPRGLDVEILSYAALERAWREDHNPEWREHVTEYLLHHPEIFSMRGVSHEVDCSAHRWTVDTPEDLELIRRIYANFGHDRFSWLETLNLMDKNPEWFEINRHVAQKTV